VQFLFHVAIYGVSDFGQSVTEYAHRIKKMGRLLKSVGQMILLS